MDIESSVSVVNMEHEMFNDGLFFIREANETQNLSEKWRCYRFAIISFASSFESFLNRRIKHKLSNDPSNVSNGQAIYDFLSKGVRNKGVPKEVRTIQAKINLMETLYDLNKKSLDNASYKSFMDLIYLRNNIVHYSYDKLNVYGDTIEQLALNGSNLLRKLIKDYCFLTNENFPNYYRETEYKLIEF